MTQLIATVLTDLLRLVILGVGGYCITWLRAHMTQAQLTVARTIAERAVAFTEQVAQATGMAADAKAKFEHALEYCRTMATKAGLHLTDTEWQGLIEGAVGDLRLLWGVVTQNTTQHGQ